MPNEVNPRQKDEIASYHRPARGEGERLDYPFADIPEFGETREISEGIHWLTMPLPFSLKAINLYLFDDGDGWTILDSGLNTSMVRDYWDGVFDKLLDGKPVNRIVITHMHPDHSGLAGWLVERTGAPLHMTRAEFLMARTLLLEKSEKVPEEAMAFYKRAGFPPIALEAFAAHGYGNFSRAVWALPIGYRRMRHGDMLEFGGRKWRVITGSGHSPEHASLFCEDDKILISGDQLLPRITSNVSVYPVEPYGDPLGEWFASLYGLEHLPGDTLVLPSHNEPFRNVQQRTKDIRAAHIRRLVALVELCAEPKTAVEGFPVLFRRKLTGMDYVMATGEAIAHMHYLEKRGHVERLSDGGIDRFRTIADFDPESVAEEFDK